MCPYYIQRINRITQVLQQNLEGMFTEGLTTSNEEMLTRCLRTYITIDKVCFYLLLNLLGEVYLPVLFITVFAYFIYKPAEESG